MSDADYDFWSPLEMPVLLGGAAVVSLFFAIVGGAISWRLPRYSWIAGFLFFGLVSVVVSVVLIFVWMDNLALPLEDFDAVRNNPQPDPFGNKHNAANILMLLLGLIVAGSSNGVAFFVLFFVKALAGVSAKEPALAHGSGGADPSLRSG
jgi:hypothetical protein